MKRAYAVRVVGPHHWIGWPALAALMATLVFATPVRLFGLPLPEPVFAMVLAFAWPLIRPSILAPFALFTVGLFMDLFWGGPMGLWGLSLLIPYSIVLISRSLILGQTLRIIFGWYVACTASAFAFAFVFTALDAKNNPSVVAVLLQLSVTILLFPFTDYLVRRFDEGDVRFR
jgi:rod shape-determining protein MreD